MIQLFVIAGGSMDPCWYLFSISYQYFLDCWLCVVIFVKFLLVHIGRCSLLFITSDCDRHSFLWGILRLPLFCLLIFVSIFLQIFFILGLKWRIVFGFIGNFISTVDILWSKFEFVVICIYPSCHDHRRRYR